MGPQRRTPSGGSNGQSSSSQGNDGGAGRNQAVLVAVIAAVATIAAAVIGLIKPGSADQATSTPQPSPFTVVPRGIAPNAIYPTTQPSIQMNLVRFDHNENDRFILVTGSINTLPANGDPVRPAFKVNSVGRSYTVKNFYASDPASINPDGSWAARIELDATESRDLAVRAVLTDLCNFLPSDDPRCGIPVDMTPPPNSTEPTVGAAPPGPTEQPPSHNDHRQSATPSQQGAVPGETERQSLERLGPQSPSVRAVSGTTTVATHP
jgi:hypothetical protein